MNLEGIDLKALEEMYNLASAGTESPDLIFYYCEDCGVEFTFLRDGAGDVPCEHIKEKFFAPLGL